MSDVDVGDYCVFKGNLRVYLFNLSRGVSGLGGKVTLVLGKHDYVKYRILRND